MESRKSIDVWNEIEPGAAAEKRMLEGILADARQLGRSNRKEFFMNTKNVYTYRPRRLAAVGIALMITMTLSAAALAATGALGKWFAVPAPFVPPSDIPTPRSQDISEEEAFGIVQAEIERVFSADVSGYRKQAAYEFSIAPNGLGDASWAINIANESYSYMCVLDAVTGQIFLLHRSDFTKVAGALEAGHSPLPGNNRYNEAAMAAMSIVAPETPIVRARFFRDGSIGTQAVCWIAVSLDTGSDYLIGIAKDDGAFAGYSYNNGRIDEALFNP
ncbi:MAG: hypothetical protein FWG93_03070 [Oscillospiraceae bacterium]|nr:hypothetical protein [Oscillospiraceae bacterium]